MIQIITMMMMIIIIIIIIITMAFNKRWSLTVFKNFANVLAILHKLLFQKTFTLPQL